MGRKAGPRPLSADRCVALSHHSASLGPFPHKLTEGDRTSRPFQLPPALTSWTCCHKREVGLQTTHQTPHILNRGPPRLVLRAELGGGMRPTASRLRGPASSQHPVTRGRGHVCETPASRGHRGNPPGGTPALLQHPRLEGLERSPRADITGLSTQSSPAGKVGSHPGSTPQSPSSEPALGSGSSPGKPLPRGEALPPPRTEEEHEDGVQQRPATQLTPPVRDPRELPHPVPWLEVQPGSRQWPGNQPVSPRGAK